MAKLPSAFKRKDHGSKGSFIVPTGKYTAKITESDYLPNKKQNGHYLKLVFSIVGGEQKGKKIFVYLNLDNPNENAVEMANNELGSICDAVGAGIVKDSSVLHGKPMIIHVREVPAEGSKPAQNVIDAYESMEGGEEESEELTAKEVISLLKEYEEEFGVSNRKKMLKKFDIKKPVEIKDLDEDDLAALFEELEDAME